MEIKIIEGFSHHDAAALARVDSPIRLKRRGSQSNQVVEHKWGTRPDTGL